MNIRPFLVIAISMAMGFGIIGCESTDLPIQAENVSVILASGHTLPSAVASAATRRGWLPQKQEDGTIRCTFHRKDNLVVVDVVPSDKQSFSVRLVESNVPVRKYNQWVNNLVHDIIFFASH